MKILRDVPVSLTADYVLQEQYRRRKRPARAWLKEATQEALTLSRSLVASAAIYDELRVRAVDGEQVILTREGEDEAGVLRVGAKVDLLAPAKRAMVAVYTIGPSLERRVQELQAQGDSVLSYMLDTVGVLALGAVGETLRCIAEERAEALGWGVSPALSPGSLVGWSIIGQRALCALLPLEEIGVRLNDHYVLEPHKSVSMLIGLGPEYAANHVGSVCRFCALADNCWRRREEAA